MPKHHGLTPSGSEAKAISESLSLNKRPIRGSEKRGTGILNGIKPPNWHERHTISPALHVQINPRSHFVSLLKSLKHDKYSFNPKTK